MVMWYILSTKKNILFFIDMITKKEMLPQVIERMKWKKFGKVAGQDRGVLEPGIVEINTDEIHIIDRKRDIEKA